MKCYLMKSFSVDLQFGQFDIPFTCTCRIQLRDSNDYSDDGIFV